MRALFVLDARAWANAPARHAVSTLASLLELPCRIGDPAATPAADDALVFVGAEAAAPADAAAVIAVDGWPDWNAATLERITVAGEPIPCPPGTPGSPAGGRVFPAAWLRSAAFSLAREEERQDTRRDQWQCYSGVYTRLAAIGLLERPFVNHMARSLERVLEAHAAARGQTLEKLPRWKHGARFAVALTHDVDDVTRVSWRQACRLLRAARSPRSYALRAGLGGLARAVTRPPGSIDSYWTFERWMDEEERRGFRSTFYFCPPAPSRRHEYDGLYTMDDVIGYRGRRITVRELLCELTARGHEVGLHGSYLSHASGEELARQRAQVADAAAGAGVAGIRQHFLRFEIGRTWRAQAEAGFGYDTTLGYNEALGFRAGIAGPYRPWDPTQGSVYGPWQLPLTAMDGTLFRTLKLDAGGAAEAVSHHLAAVEEAGGLAVLLWHPNAADEASFPGWWASYSGALDEASRRGAWVAPAGEIARWWGERAGRA